MCPLCAKKAHAVFEARPCVAWDVALTKDGPIIIELNAYFGLQTLRGAANWRSRVLRHFVDDHEGCAGGFTPLPKDQTITRDALVRARITASGHVQAIGFRKSARTVAQQLRLHGFARNLDDRSVSMEVIGPISTIEVFVQRLRFANTKSKVEAIHAEIIEIIQDSSFVI